MEHFYPAAAQIPLQWQTEWCFLRPLRATDVEMDFDAVMDSGEALRAASNHRWPRPDFTLEEDLVDLQHHEADFLARRGFTYTILNPEQARCLGCVYIYPSGKVTREKFGPTTGTVRFWLRPECIARDQDRDLFAGLRAWLADDWSFPLVLWWAAPSDVRHIAMYEAVGFTRVMENTLKDDGISYYYA
jgi:hypothetical protein